MNPLAPEPNMNWHQTSGGVRPFSDSPVPADSPFSPALVDEMVRGLCVLIVDDEPLNVMLLRHILESAGYGCLISTSEPREVADLCQTHAPDLLLLDWMMPHISGLDVLQGLRAALKPGEFLPVMVLTADASPPTRRTALSQGAQDFLTKPFDQAEVLLRVRNLLATRLLHVQQQDANRRLEERVEERTRALVASQVEVLERLAQAAEFRDDDTGQHTRRVGDLAAQIAREAGLDEEQSELIRRAAPLHDVGKIGVSDTILLKPGKLTNEEFDIIKTHTLLGAQLLRDGSSPLIALAECIARSHHERFDGRGYPGALEGENIPLEGRIVAVADVFDALTHERPYKRAWPVEEALAEIQKGAGTQFDPRVVEAFLRLFAPSEKSSP